MTLFSKKSHASAKGFCTMVNDCVDFFSPNNAELKVKIANE